MRGRAAGRRRSRPAGRLTVPAWRAPAAGEAERSRPRRSGAWRTCALLLGAAAPVAAQDPPSGRPPPPDSVPPDSLRADSAVVAPPPDSAAVDTLPPPPVLPSLDDIGPARGAPGVWEWDRDALLAARGQTLLDLLSQVPGVLSLRGGDFGASATAVPVGVAGGGLRLYYDGVEHLPLNGAVPDLSRVALSGLQRVRAIRRGSGLDVRLFRFAHADARPYALIEAGTGDLDTNVLRATFSYPRVVRGKAALAIERIDARGADDAGAVTGGWFRYSLHRGDRAGLRFEYRRVSSEQSAPADAPGLGAQRSDWTVQGVWEPAAGLLAEAWATGAALAPSPDSAGADARAGTGVGPVSRRQYGARVAGGTDWLWARGALRVNGGAGVPERELAADASAAHPRWGGASLHGWRESWGGAAGAGYDARAWADPVSFLTVFAEAGDGRRSAPLRGPPLAPPDSAEASGGSEPGAAPPNRFVQRARSRYGLVAARWGARLSAARLSVEADSVRPTQLPFDRDGLVAAQPRRRAWEFAGRVPLWPRGLHLRAQVQLWDAAPAASPDDSPVPADSVSPNDSLPPRRLPGLYFPDHLYDAALSFHRTFLPTENFELWVDLGARGRAEMAVPSPRPPEDAEGDGPQPSIVPFYQDWYLRVQMRFLSLNVFISVENLTLRDANQDAPGRVLPGTRGLYGVRWTLWN